MKVLMVILISILHLAFGQYLRSGPCQNVEPIKAEDAEQMCEEYKIVAWTPYAGGWSGPIVKTAYIDSPVFTNNNRYPSIQTTGAFKRLELNPTVPGNIGPYTTDYKIIKWDHNEQTMKYMVVYKGIPQINQITQKLECLERVWILVQKDVTMTTADYDEIKQAFISRNWQDILNAIKEYTL